MILGTPERSMKSEPVLRRCAAFVVAMVAQAALLSASVAPGWIVESWTTRTGLPSNSVNDLVQTRDGYLWIATWNGLARFDGARFTLYNTTTHPDLASNRLTSIREDSDGSLWLSTEQNHLVRYLRGRFSTFGESEGLVGGEVHCFYREPDGTLWVGDNAGAARIRGGQLERIAKDVVRARVVSILRDRGGALWFGSFGGITRLAAGTTTRWHQREGLPNGEVLALFQTSSGQIMAGTTEGLLRHIGDRWERIELPPTVGRAAVHAIEEGDDAELWLATARGIVRRDKEGFHYESNSAPWIFRRDRPFRRDTERTGWSNTGNRLYRDRVLIFDSSDVIMSTLHDREGNVWIGTWQSGLHRIRQSRFTIYGKERGLVSEKVYPIHQDRAGTIWLGTIGGGLSRFHDGRFATFAPPPVVYSIAEDSSGSLWVGSDRIYRFSNGQCSTAGIPSPIRDAVEVRAIFEDSRGRLWVGAKNGLYLRDGRDWKRLVVADGEPMVRVIAESADRAVWLGTNGGGLLRYREGRFERLTTANGLPSNLIRSIHEQPAGTLWVGTEDRGLVRLTGPSGKLDQMAIQTIDSRAGLFSDGIHQILPDRRGRLWMSSNEGIFHAAIDQLLAFRTGGPRVHSIAYTDRDGIGEANGGVQSAGIRGADGRLWFGTQEGVAVIDPDAVQRLPPPPVIVESLRSEEDVFAVTGVLELAPRQRNFQIDYTAIAFSEAERIRFRYRLEGYDLSWVDAGQRRSAFYTKVPAGRYRFEVQAQDADGSLTGGGATLSMTIGPYLREMIWFRLLLVAVVAALVAGGTFWRTRHLVRRQLVLEGEVADRTVSLQSEKIRAEEALAKVEEQNEALAMLDEMKTRFFSDASHELRTPLTLIVGPLSDVLDEKHGPLSSPVRQRLTVMKRNALRLHRLVNQMLDLHRIESGGLRLERKTRDLRPFVRDVVSAFLPLAERHRIELVLDLDPDPCPVSFDGDQMEKILANLLSNAMKFAPPGGWIGVRMRHEAGTVLVAVSDDGSGIPPEEIRHVFDRFYRGAHASVMREGTGIGLALVRELVHRHGGTIDVQSRPGVETIFTVRLPRSEDVVMASDDSAPHDATAAEWAAEERVETHPAGDSTTVLVVEDNPDVRNYIAEILQPRYRVLVAGDGRRGLEVAVSELPDLIVSDVLMPHLDGISFCRELRANAETECIPVILLTALASTRDEVAGIQTGADEYLVKPFSSVALRARVDGLLAQRHRLRERMRADLVQEYSRRKKAPPPAEGLTARVSAFILDHLHDEGLTVERLADAMAMSRSTLHRGLQDQGTTATELLRVTRLEKAGELLLAARGSVSEIAYAVGFQSLAHFSRSFREHFGVPPSQYASVQPAGPVTPRR